MHVRNDSSYLSLNVRMKLPCVVRIIIGIYISNFTQCSFAFCLFLRLDGLDRAIRKLNEYKQAVENESDNVRNYSFFRFLSPNS